jgi:hypothetical protein
MRILEIVLALALLLNYGDSALNWKVENLVDRPLQNHS